jgi:hypothetical protein
MSVAACKALKAVKRAEGRPGAEGTGGTDTLGNCQRQKATAEEFDSRQGSFVGQVLSRLLGVVEKSSRLDD